MKINIPKISKKQRYIILVVVVIILGASYLLRLNTLKNTVSKRLKDQEFTRKELTTDVYDYQLTKRETKVYNLLKDHLDKYKGGIIDLGMKINGEEYLRVLSAIELNKGDYFYGFFDIPMNDNYKYMLKESKDIKAIAKDEISKVILFLSCSKNPDIKGVFSDDGVLINRDEINDNLKENNPKKLEKIKKIQEETVEILNKVLAKNNSKNGDLKTVEFFQSWINKNIGKLNKGDQGQIDTISQMFDDVYVGNHIAAVVNRRGYSLGFCKILSYLCQESGIDSFVVAGPWKGGFFTQSNYCLTVANINGQWIFIDTFGEKKNVLGGEKYMTINEAKNHMDMEELFKILPYSEWKSK